MRKGFILCLAVVLWVQRAAGDDTVAKKEFELTVLKPPKAEAAATDRFSVTDPPDLKHLLGKPVRRAEVTLAGETWGNTHLPVIASLLPNEPFAPEVARRALDEVLATGRFARGDVAVLEEGGGLRLIVHVTARKAIDSIRVDRGEAEVDSDELLRVGSLAEGGELVGADLFEQVDRMEAYLGRRGYPNAAINLRTEQLDANPIRVRVVVEVSAKAPRIVARREFYVSDPTLVAEKEITQAYPFEIGTRADEEALNAGDQQLRKRLRELGFYAPTIVHDVVKWGEEIVLRVRVELGDKLIFRFEGNDHYDEDTLLASLELAGPSGEDASLDSLKDRVHKFYRQRGFLDVEVDVERRASSRSSVKIVVFRLRENPRVMVREARRYPCLPRREIASLNESGPTSEARLNGEIDAFLEEELPGVALFRNPDPRDVRSTLEGPGLVPRSNQAVPLDLDPRRIYAPATYDKALEHVRDLYRSEGYLHAEVGPLQVLRRKCLRDGSGTCVPIPFPGKPPELCTYNERGMPLELPSLPEAFSCHPDPTRGVTCEPAVTLRIPVRLGPRSILYDVAFRGTRAIDDKQLARSMDLPLGEPINALRVDDARQKILDLYRDRGYAFADVRASLDESLDHTRARARFDVIEGERVIIERVVVKGNVLTNSALIRKRVTLEVGQPFRTGDVRRSEEQLAGLGLFSGVEIGLADPYVPQKYKAVYVRVTENQTARYGSATPSGGVSTGEGLRGGLEYSNRVILGGYVGITTRGSASYLPDLFVQDDSVKANLRQLGGGINRVAYRLTARSDVPDIGLGPRTAGAVDLAAFRMLQRDFLLTKIAAIPSVNHAFSRAVHLSLAQTVEDNQVRIFSANSLEQYLLQSGANLDTQRQLRVPEGRSRAFAQRLSFSFDQRDNPLNPHRGTYAVAGVEHVDWFPIAETTTGAPDPSAVGAVQNFSGHFFHLSGTVAAHFPVSKRVTFAAALQAGLNLQLSSTSKTYPDRYFFLGGPDAMRGWRQDEFMPQDYVDRIENEANFTARNVAIRGGDLMVNPKVELRIPLSGRLETAIFVEAGNLWVDPKYAFEHPFKLRASFGSGLRYQTPVGPLVFDVGFKANEVIEELRASAGLPRSRFVEDLFALNFRIGVF